MSPLRALLSAMRDRRRPVPGEPPEQDPGLVRLLDAARAPATAEELAGEQAAVAVFTAHRRRAARTARRTGSRTRAVLVPVTTGLALLILGTTAAAARTGNLPQEAQQHAHRLFSALGVPAPRTGPDSGPAGGDRRSPSPSRSPAPAPAPTRSVDVVTLGWCESWRGGVGGQLSKEERRKLAAAAGDEGRIERYCADLKRAAGPGGGVLSPSAGATSPSASVSVPSGVTPSAGPSAGRPSTGPAPRRSATGRPSTVPAPKGPPTDRPSKGRPSGEPAPRRTSPGKPSAAGQPPAGRPAIAPAAERSATGEPSAAAEPSAGLSSVAPGSGRLPPGNGS